MIRRSLVTRRIGVARRMVIRTIGPVRAIAVIITGGRYFLIDAGRSPGTGTGRGPALGDVGVRRQWRRLRRPGLVIAFGRLRRFAARRRFNFETPITRQMARTWIIMPDLRNRIDSAATVNGRLHMGALAKTPIALDHRI